MEFYKIAYKFLKEAKVPVSKSYLRERLESHAFYPSLNALTDILDELEIENSVVQVEAKQRWRELPFPFLSHVVSKTGQLDFQVIKNQEQIKSEEDFLNNWTGITVLIGQKRKITHNEHEKQYNKEKSERIMLWSIIGCLLVLFLLQQLTFFNWMYLTHFVLSCAGLLVSIAIIAYSLGISTDVSDLFCKIGTSNCKKVLTSKLGKWGGDIGLSDVSAVFFGGLLIYTSFSLHFNGPSNLEFLTFLSVLAFLFTLLSLSYQAYIGSWCKLCLSLTLIIWLQAATSVFYLLQQPNGISLSYPPTLKHYIAFGISIALAASWFIIKPLFMAKRNTIFHKIRLRKWRQNPDWFNALLPLHKKVDNAVWEREIFYGNPKGVLQILIVSSPFCHYCAKAHFELEESLKIHPEDIGVGIRFTLRSLATETKDYKAVFHILNAYEELVWKKKPNATPDLMKEIISDWFKTANLDQWVEKYAVPNQNTFAVKSLISKSIEWANHAGIYQTPAFFINDHEMPNPHTFRDLFLFVSEYIAILKKPLLPVSQL